MRFRVPEIFLGCFLTVAIFAVGMLFERLEKPSSPTQYESEHGATSQSQKSQQPDSELAGSTWLTKDAAGFFTFGLVLVGIGQAALFFFQLRYMRKGMEDAKVAADAAKAAAEAAKSQAISIIRAERPYVFVKITRPGIALLDDGSFQFAPDEKNWLSFDFVNHGKTPAYLDEFFERYPIIDRGTFPTAIEPISSRGRLLPVGTISSQTFPHSQNTKLLNRPDADLLLTDGAWKKKQIYFQGYLRYSDAFGNRYIVGWLARFFPEHNQWALRGGKEYNYTRQEEPAGIPPHPDYPDERL